MATPPFPSPFLHLCYHGPLLSRDHSLYYDVISCDIIFHKKSQGVSVQLRSGGTDPEGKYHVCMYGII